MNSEDSSYQILRQPIQNKILFRSPTAPDGQRKIETATVPKVNCNLAHGGGLANFRVGDGLLPPRSSPGTGIVGIKPEQHGGLFLDPGDVWRYAASGCC